MLLVGGEATESKLSTLTSGGSAHFDVLHIATHALIDNEKPERSGLVLSQEALSPHPDDGLDGIVTGGEIIEPWKLDAELVALSACRTAHGRNVYGEGVVGLAYPFLQAGARSLLVSLWPVEDHATALLMRRFYETWLSSAPRDSAAAGTQAEVGLPRTSKAEALREAKRWLREYRDETGARPYEHPYYWSAFVLIGDPGKGSVRPSRRSIRACRERKRRASFADSKPPGRVSGGKPSLSVPYAPSRPLVESTGTTR